MIPLELSKDLNPNLIFDDVFKRHTLNRLNDILKVKFTIPEHKKYMVVMKYNSIDSPRLNLYLDNKAIDLNFCKTKTGSLDYIISINYKNGY